MSSRSGVDVNPDCIEKFQELKLRKVFKYIIFKLNNTLTEIIIEKTSASKDYEEFISDLPETELRWAVYDFEFESGEGKRNKLIFYSWSPDGAKVKQKMVYASSKDVLRRSLIGTAIEIQATDYSEVSHESVLEKAVTRR